MSDPLDNEAAGAAGAAASGDSVVASDSPAEQSSEIPPEPLREVSPSAPAGEDGLPPTVSESDPSVEASANDPKQFSGKESPAEEFRESTSQPPEEMPDKETNINGDRGATAGGAQPTAMSAPFPDLAPAAKNATPPVKYQEPNASGTALLDERKPVPFDEETNEKKLKYPKSVFFIISNEFCERFSYYGMRTILVLYLTSVLSYEQDDATVIYHVFTMLCYFFPLLGSMIADSWLGKFKTIFSLSIVYAAGNIVISFASASGEGFNIPGRELTIVGLLLIAFGTGGIKPCVSAFGGDQFILPQQEKQMAQFFSLFYFAINSGSLVSTFLTPILRQDVQCLNQESCYPLAFGVPAILMIVSIIIFVAGRSLYIVKKPQGNIVLQVLKCMGHAVSRRRHLKGEKREHWLDYADDTYDKRQIEDIKSALRVLYLYLPLPFFWALFDQQGSRWTFQATRMTGELGSWSLKPDQMQVVNPLLILVFIPMFETMIYPLLKKCNILTRPLTRLGTGGMLAALAFGISAIVELQIEKTYAVLPKSGNSQIRIFNGLPCDIVADLPAMQVNIKEFDVWTNISWPVSKEGSLTINLKNCDEIDVTSDIKIYEKQAASFLITPQNILSFHKDEVEKIKEVAVLRVLYSDMESSGKTLEIGTKSLPFNATSGSTDLNEFTPGTYDVKIDGTSLDNVELKVGGVYTLLLGRDAQKQKMVSNLHEITPPNSVHMMWLVPQYVILTMGEVMFSITGLEFSYSQAPLSMKSVMQAGWLLTVAFGNLIVVIIAEAKIFDRQLFEFVLFAGLMFVDMLLFALMAMGYKYLKPPHEDQDDLALTTTKEQNGIENKNMKTDEQ